MTADLRERLAAAWAARQAEFGNQPPAGRRLFNGFLEGAPDLQADLYGATLVLYNHANPPARAEVAVAEALAFYQSHLPGLRCALVKTRHARTVDARRGQVIWGAEPETRLTENGVHYALNLQLNQDAGFYLDTRHLRAWLSTHCAGQTVLNTFAYTGSLGVAALAGGARRVIHTDRSRAFLALARTSQALNQFPSHPADFLVGDFFRVAGRLRHAGAVFDGVIIDPPFFAEAGPGRVDLVAESGRLINKVRPLVADGGWIAAVNNALFLSGAEYLRTLEALGADGYLTVEALVPVPADCAGYPETKRRPLPADPAPFTHATKIALLRVRRKAGSGRAGQPSPTTGDD